MSIAVLSVAALALAIVVSCVTTLNVGVLSIALAWCVGVLIGGMPVNTVMGGFPGQLFLTLVGVTLLFTLAQCNGTLDRLAHYAVRCCRGNRGVMPIMFFVLAAGLASIGPGNIATAALMAPMAMATAGRVGIPLFLMAIMVGNGANAGSLSPFAPTGIIVNGVMARIEMPGYELQTYVYNLLAHAMVAFGGYFLFGGWKLFLQQAPVACADPVAPATTGGPMETRHWITVAVIATLLVSVIVFDVNVGMGAFAAAVILVLCRCADDREALRRMPWGVIVMVSGVTVLIAVLERAEGIDLIVAQLARFATRETVTGQVALLTGLVSVYSSTSGVVLPAFLPMVPGLAQQLGSTNPFAIASSMNIGGHLVDVSPLSTIGALCIASAPIPGESRALFNKLLAWGLSMAVVGGIVCYVIF
ncbi:MAG: C4-dicarboxylate ABC transporter [Luteitalea sp.]|nr:C4-dicarboxylate ABC transporter [Luteitalea sp.]